MLRALSTRHLVSVRHGSTFSFGGGIRVTEPKADTSRADPPWVVRQNCAIVGSWSPLSFPPAATFSNILERRGIMSADNGLESMREVPMPSRNSLRTSRPLPVHKFLSPICALALAIALIDTASAQPRSGRAQKTPNPLQLNQQMPEFASQGEAKEIASQRGWPIRETLPDGGVMELQAIYNGLPYYYKTCNLTAAQSVSTDECWPGGGSGFGLTGAGITLGIWDGGAVRTTHQEFGGRAVQRDGASELSGHATHVSGTLIAAGVNAPAKGMSFQASLNCYDWNNDVYEMRQEAAAGLRVSNHSYGPISGWEVGPDCHDGSGSRWWWFGDISVSEEEDYLFGFYYYDAQEFDQVAYDYPHYLFCGSAGNDRNDGPGGTVLHCYYGEPISGVFRYNDGGNSGGYDTIAGAALAKNGLCVGAVEDVPGGYTNPAAVSMTSFSCWGPADDGRIKPDIVGNGRGLISPLAGSDSQYASIFDDYSGTSMSSPNVAGSLGLLIQHWRSTHPGFADMLSSTLKALVLHTADECGNHDGPDYRFGWGLLNTWKAAQVITDDVTQPAIISEQHVGSNGVFDVILTTDGFTSELRATICWIDMPATVQPPALDPTTRMLVNDLDMSISSTTRPLGFFPWILDPANPAGAAQTGDNDVDNVEQIVIKNPGTDTWLLRIVPDGPLANGAQRFSLIITGASAMTLDCNENGTADHIDISSGTSSDCNANQVPDECEIEPAGAGQDCNEDGILDECQIAGNDCNNNGIIDACDIADTTSEDCNDNGEPDECEIDTPLYQPPNASTGIFADADCDLCSEGEQTLADNFTITAPKIISSIVIFGGYYPDDLAMESDNFTVRFLEDDDFLLGSVVASQSGVDSTKTATGEFLFGVQEYQYTLLLDPPVSLDPGTYFVEIFNNTAGNTDSFFWEGGTVDPEAGIVGSFFDFTTPGATDGSSGAYDPVTDLAVTLAVASPDVDCNADGLLDACYTPLAVDLGPDHQLAPDRTHPAIAPNMQILAGTPPFRYTWQIISGPSPLGIGNPYAENPSFTPPDEGTYVVRCTVQDSSPGPCTATDDIVVEVKPLTIGLPEILYGCVETQSRPLGDIPIATGGTPPYGYFWEVLEGPTTFSDAAKVRANPTLTPPTDEDYILQLTVTDSSNPPYVATKAAQMVVEAPPSVDAGEVAQYHPVIMVNEALNLGGAPTATGGHPPYDYGWSIPLNPDGAGSISDPTAPNPIFTATEKGAYVVRVQITDLGGCSAETWFTISVVTDPPSSLVPVTPGGSAVACGLCAPASGATIAMFIVGYLALYAGRRSRRR